jgi:hypothetical protein
MEWALKCIERVNFLNSKQLTKLGILHGAEEMSERNQQIHQEEELLFMILESYNHCSVRNFVEQRVQVSESYAESTNSGGGLG